MSTMANLRNRTAKDLAAMAKRKGIPGWHAMRKEELIKALGKVARKTVPKKSSNHKASSNGAKKKTARAPSAPTAARKAPTVKSSSAKPKVRSARLAGRLRDIRTQVAISKDLAHRSESSSNGTGRDRLVAIVRDSHWIQVCWEVSRASVQRAEAAMGQHWHGARPVLRILEVLRNGTTSAVRKHLRDIAIHGEVNTWYVDVASPPKSFQFEIGYLAPNGKFLCLARSNIVTTMRTRMAEPAELPWTEKPEDYQRVYALSGGYDPTVDTEELKELLEERLGRSLLPWPVHYGLGASSLTGKHKEFHLQVETEVVLYGKTSPGAQVTIRGEPVRVEGDGSFHLRMEMPERRQVLPVVAQSPDATEQRTIVLALERNTKVMEPVVRDPDAAVRE